MSGNDERPSKKSEGILEWRYKFPSTILDDLMEMDTSYWIEQACIYCREKDLYWVSSELSDNDWVIDKFVCSDCGKDKIVHRRRWSYEVQ